jgi:zinc protease
MNILNLDYERYKLDNGLEVILHQNNNHPLVSVNLWYRAGSCNEKKGKTGIAHLFEHMMFQGSKNVPKEMHFRYIQEAGGSLNGSTSFDRTNYYEKVPSNFLELILWLESDRMCMLLPSLTQEKLKNQVDVVRNERLERYDNQPYGLAWEKIINNLYPEGHPYSWPTIGYIDDMNSYTLEDVTDFFKTYYSPSNACLIIAGNFDRENAKELVEKYFSDVESKNTPVNMFIPPIKLEKDKVIISKENVQLERLYLAWPTEKAFGPFDASLDIIGDILSGSKNARLYKNLVYEKEIAQDVSAYQFSGKYAGHFLIIATAKPEVELALLREEIFKELENICANGVTQKELVRSKNGIKSSFIYSMQNIESLADQLNFYNFYLGEPNSFNFDLSRYENTTEVTIKKCVNKYFKKSHIELQISPVNGKAELK